MDLQPGAVLQGKYLLNSSIGRGGMGEVFAATRVADGQQVAIKVVSRRIVDDTLMARLEREAVAAGRIRSMYVPEVYEVDRTTDGELFLVMRLLHGEPLATRLRDRRALHWPEVQHIVDDVLSALADAHAAGVVHRDLKPGNIFLEHIDEVTIPGHTPGQTPAAAWIPTDATERAMILDFGVCKLDTSDAPKLTVTGESVGTISYMAPEQIRGASGVDGRADLYALAMVAFEMLCGRIAFDATGQMAILAAKLEGRPRKLRDCAVVAVPAGLDALISKALARKPQDRFASAREMQQAWRALGPPTEAPKAVISQSLPPAYQTQTAMTANTRTRVGITPRVGLVLASVSVFVAAVALGFAFRKTPTRAPAEPVSDEPPSVSIAPADPGPTALGSAAPTVYEIADVTADAGTRTKRTPSHGVWRPPATTKHTAATSGTHITTEPRY